MSPDADPPFCSGSSGSAPRTRTPKRAGDEPPLSLQHGLAGGLGCRLALKGVTVPSVASPGKEERPSMAQGRVLWGPGPPGPGPGGRGGSILCFEVDSFCNIETGGVRGGGAIGTAPWSLWPVSSSSRDVTHISFSPLAPVKRCGWGFVWCGLMGGTRAHVLGGRLPSGNR